LNLTDQDCQMPVQLMKWLPRSHSQNQGKRAQKYTLFVAFEWINANFVTFQDKKRL